MSRYIDADDIDNITVVLDSRGCLKRIEAPTADVEPVAHAHWVKTRLCNECSRCRSGWLGLPETKRCPECGARMDEEEKEDQQIEMELPK